MKRAPKHIVGPDGLPLLGRFAGEAESFDWAGLAAPHARSALWRRFHHKKWHYVALVSEQVLCAVAIVDVGWTSTCFGYAFDRNDGDIVANFSQDGRPFGASARVADSAGGSSSFSARGTSIDIEALADGRYRLTLVCPYLEIDAEFGPPSAPLLLATGTVNGGSVHATQKSPGMALSGEVRTWRDEYRLDGGAASFDYSNGLLARETSWKWASAHTLDMGFNLQAGYFGGNENALWLDGELIPLAPAHFIYDQKDPLEPWHIFTEDDQLDLIFTPESARRQDRRMVVAASRYIQPIGSFSGWVRASPDAPKRMVESLVGVTEDHYSRW
ncbi:DUF2804 domain-containing protein [Massilia endophytica]|uniref:DUF2804 domain-containing protein n=1 Tax=Massilia endophytica TaxID=2899220 RepID=UPI001E2882A8|nr:DUF2804 domain-containing protein [Massilia endophytica]UGQ44617.1 DUF2804 domain-containing protein [Massilia endophytica]